MNATAMLCRPRVMVDLYSSNLMTKLKFVFCTRVESGNGEDWSTEEEIVSEVVEQPTNNIPSRNDVNNFLKR